MALETLNLTKNQQTVLDILESSSEPLKAYTILFDIQKKGIKSPKKPGMKKVKTNIGTIIILPMVKILGIFIFIRGSNYIFSLLCCLLFLLQISNHQN